MIRSGGFLLDDFPGLSEEHPEHMPLILSDLLKGGYMGAKEKSERFESGMEYNRQLIQKRNSALQYRLRMLGWKIKSGTKYMFPSVKMLRKLYPLTINRPLLMPIFWVWQAVSFPVKKIFSGALQRDVRSENSTVTAITERRIAIFKELGML